MKSDSARRPTSSILSLLSDDTGQDLIEYALLAATIGLVGIVAWQNIVTGIGDAYQGWDTNTQAIWEPQDPV